MKALTEVTQSGVSPHHDVSIRTGFLSLLSFFSFSFSFRSLFVSDNFHFGPHLIVSFVIWVSHFLLALPSF